jgi:hypothetical protein
MTSDEKHISKLAGDMSLSLLEIWNTTKNTMDLLCTCMMNLQEKTI